MKRFIFGLVAVFLLTAMPVSAEDSHIGITVKKFSTATPNIDGTVTSQEWGEPVASITPSSPNYLQYMEEANGQNTDSVIPSKVELYLGWTSSNLYVAMKVTDSTHFNPFEGADCWIGDSFECDIGVKESDQKVRFRNNIALGKNNVVYGIIHNKPNGDLSGNVASGENMPGTLKVTRADNITTYELELPWSTYSSSGSVNAGYKFYLNPQLHIADGVLKGTGEGYTDYLGMVRYGTKDAEGNTLYPLLTLQGNGTEETDSTTGGDTDETTDDNTDETTGDDSDNNTTDDENDSSEDNDDSGNDPSPSTGSSTPVAAVTLISLLSFATIAACRKKNNH